ncbi:MAG: NmrA family NAD(P)-binding protein, partial [Anaerolineae bacterium]|nr:NmrA family NAD(P)-binding protein [Anaerolineae bacterium]
MILVTGAAGKTGQAIIRALTARQAAVRAFVYRPEHEQVVGALDVQETVIGDLADEAAYFRAADGVDAVYHICPNMNPYEENLGIVAINSAKKAGVKGFVYHSVLHPQTEQMPHHWHKLRTEARLFESGLNVTILQPAAYMQNILAGWRAIVDEGIYRVPYPVQTKL